MKVGTGRFGWFAVLAALACTTVGLWTWASQGEARDLRSHERGQILTIDPADAERDTPALSGAHDGQPVDLAPVTPPGKPQPDPPADPKTRVSVLVHMHPGLQRHSVERAGVKQFTLTKGGFTRYEYKILPNVINLRNVPVDALADLKNLPGVLRIEEDTYHPNVVRLDESTPLVRALDSQLSAAGINVDGSGIRVCVADTGIDMDHVMYSSRIDTAASYDFANNDSNPDDDNGHGSHVAGIAVGGTGLNIDFGCEGSEPFQGVAPGATLIGAKILNSFGGGTDSDIIAGIDHCADQSPSGGRADVINLSIGTGNFSSGACTHSWAVAANNAVANGVVVVAASGNENNANSMGSPACGADVIAVGATYKDDYPNCEDSTSNFNWGDCIDNSPGRDQIVCFSNESDFLDVAAPGSVIQSASNAAGGSSVAGQSGTSMASPMVAGLAALILDADPTLTPAQVRQIIRDGAIDMGPAGFDRAYGHGRIDVINSLNLVGPCGNDNDCDDGQFCNGAETCNAGSCEAGTPACPGGLCDEGTDSCSTLAYSWDMNTNPGWTTAGQWAWGSPTGGGGQHGSADPTGGATGSNVYGYNLSGDYANNLGETHLTTTAIDCSGLSGVTLRFQRWLGVEQPTYDHAYLRVSTNGSTWTTLWENTAEVADGSWTAQEFDVSSIADNQSTVYIRWTQGTTDSSWQYCGWNLDDVEIYASGGGGPTCSDGIQNQGEDRIDCGGPCAACDCTSDASCDNGLYCDGTEACDVFGSCVAGAAVDCGDGVGCTSDSCNESTDSCDNAPSDASCDDGQYCNGAETCDVVSDCQAGTAVSCNDGVVCTVDSCNESTDSCDSVPNDGNCDDGIYCNGAETCHTETGCQLSSPVNCDDGVACTDDSCNEAADSCDNLPNDGACSDGLFCNGAETCDAGLGCLTGGDPCPGGSCDEGADTCVACIIDADCDDGLYCNGAESCNAGSCEAGVAPSCDDGVSCTIDSCNEATDSCDVAPNDAVCNDGLFCNGVETCDSVQDCQAGVPVNCNDGVGCTADSCNEGSDSCDNLPNDLVCDDGLFCNGAETCDTVLDCVTGVDPCGGGACDEGADTCDSGNALLWMSFRSNTSIPGVGTVADEDIVSYDSTTDTWALEFDGSDVGLGSLEISGLAILPSGDLLLSFTAAGTVGGIAVDDSDVVQFTPTSMGSSTAGTFSLYFDGSDVGMTSNGEDIDSISLHHNGRLIISTLGGISANGASGADEDLWTFNATSLGSTTSGTFERLFDGSDVGLNNSGSEDIDAASFTNAGTILFSTVGNYSAGGSTGADEDVSLFIPLSLGNTTAGAISLLHDLSALGINTNEDIGSLHLDE